MKYSFQVGSQCMKHKRILHWYQIWVASYCVSVCDLYPIHFLVVYLWYNRGRGSNFTLVKQNLWTLLNVQKNVATHTDTQAIYVYWAKHNQHTRHANAKGSGGMPPTNFWKARTLWLNLGAFQDLTIAISHFNWKLISN